MCVYICIYIRYDIYIYIYTHIYIYAYISCSYLYIVYNLAFAHAFATAFAKAFATTSANLSTKMFVAPHLQEEAMRSACRDGLLWYGSREWVDDKVFVKRCSERCPLRYSQEVLVNYVIICFNL